MFSFAEPRRRRRPGLTPMIDVVFLLLVFFMLAARFGADRALPLTVAGGAGDARWEGPPRLIRVLPETVTLNGRPVAQADLPARLAPLMPGPEAPVLLQADEATRLARLVAVIDALRAAGWRRLIVVE